MRIVGDPLDVASGAIDIHGVTGGRRGKNQSLRALHILLGHRSLWVEQPRHGQSCGEGSPAEAQIRGHPAQEKFGVIRRVYSSFS